MVEKFLKRKIVYSGQGIRFIMSRRYYSYEGS